MGSQSHLSQDGYRQKEGFLELMIYNQQSLPMTQGDLKHFLSAMLKPLSLSTEQVTAEIRLFVEVGLGIPWTTILRAPEKRLTCEAIETLQGLLKRRLEDRVPIQYLLGESVFFGLTLRVNPSVLIPRPETEELVEKAIILIKERGYTTFLDMGTGSGAIAIALAHHFSTQLKGMATDISTEALKLAQENAASLSIPQSSLQFREGSFFKPVEGERFDLILSNPPYIGLEEKETLMPEVKDHEPHQALFSTKGKYFYYEEIAAHSAQYLNPGGSVLLEMGIGMADRVQTLFQEADFQQITIFQDYAGVDRICWAMGFRTS